MPDDYRRRQTLKNAERYITPELKAFEDKALSAQERALAREKACTSAAADLQPRHIRALQRIARRAWPQLDALAALAERAARSTGRARSSSPSRGIEIEPGATRWSRRRSSDFIANDCALDAERRMLLITGPNMGGKSTYMRQVALMALLAYCGSYVPASSARARPHRPHLDPYRRRRRPGTRGSTFMVEMTEAAAILHGADPQSLVLMDEIGRGTSTFDGMALAAAIARALVEDNACMTLFATHYFEITALAQRLAGVANVHVTATQTRGKLVFLHQVREVRPARATVWRLPRWPACRGRSSRTRASCWRNSRPGMAAMTRSSTCSPAAPAPALALARPPRRRRCCATRCANGCSRSNPTS